MSTRSNHSDAWDRQEPSEAAGASESTWGEGAASALESLKKREQRRDHNNPRADDDERPDAG